MQSERSELRVERADVRRTRITASSRSRARRCSPTTRCTRGSRSTSGRRTSSRWRASSASARRRSQAVPSIALGSVGVTPLEMASAYATLAAGGVYSKPMAITKVVLPNGKADTSGDWGKPQRERVIPDWVASTVTQVLEQNMLYGTGTRRARLQPHRCRQDRHDRQLRGRVVLRLHAAPHGDGVDRLSAGRDPDAERARDRRLRADVPGADLAPLHGHGDRQPARTLPFPPAKTTPQWTSWRGQYQYSGSYGHVTHDGHDDDGGATTTVARPDDAVCADDPDDRRRRRRRRPAAAADDGAAVDDAPTTPSATTPRRAVSWSSRSSSSPPSWSASSVARSWSEAAPLSGRRRRRRRRASSAAARSSSAAVCAWSSSVVVVCAVVVGCRPSSLRPSSSARRRLRLRRERDRRERACPPARDDGRVTS